MSLLRKRTSSTSSILLNNNANHKPARNSDANINNNNNNKKKNLSKPVWDSTCNDLNSLKLSAEELVIKKFTLIRIKLLTILFLFVC